MRALPNHQAEPASRAVTSPCPLGEDRPPTTTYLHQPTSACAPINPFNSWSRRAPMSLAVIRR